MFKALVRKEWRQLRLLRGAGAGFGLLLPPLLLALAGASDRGWLFVPATHTSAATVIREVLPLTLALGLWPLLALMVASQALAADRAAGTDAFLLDRPVPRSRVWLARVSAACGTTLVILAAHAAIWLLIVRLAGDPVSFDVTAALGRMLLRGGMATCVAMLAGIAAGAFARTPIQAVLFGLVLGSVPVAIGALFVGGWFWGYRLQGVPIGAGIPVILLIGYVAGSFLMECRGEPAGRGRVLRGALVLVAAFLAMPLFQAASAPLVLRWDAKLGLGNSTVIPAPSGDVALVLNNWQRAAWLIDTASRDKLRFFGPPVYGAAWTGDGSRLALVHGAGVAGRHLRDIRIEILGPSGARRRDAIVCEECREWWDDEVYWIEERIVLPGFKEGRECVLIVDPATGERRPVEIPRPVSRWTILGPPAAGALHVLRVLPPSDATGESATARPAPDLVLHRLDVPSAALGPGVDLPGVGYDFLMNRALSPSGRRWIARTPSDDERIRMLDLATGEALALPAGVATWLTDDRLAWVAAGDPGSFDLYVGHPGAERRVRTLPGRPWLWLEASPDLERLLIFSRTVVEDGEDEDLRFWIYEPKADRLYEMPVVPDLWFGAVQWAGPEKLAILEQGSLALIDARDPAGPEYVIGNPRR
jgi:hypothetical protein